MEYILKSKLYEKKKNNLSNISDNILNYLYNNETNKLRTKNNSISFISIIKNNLYKYNIDKKKYDEITFINVLNSKYFKILAVFKEKIIYNNIEEFLKKFYTKKESLKIIPLFFSFYKNYSILLDNPRYKEYKFNEFFHNINERKANIFLSINNKKNINKILSEYHNNDISIVDKNKEKNINLEKQKIKNIIIFTPNIEKILNESQSLFGMTIKPINSNNEKNVYSSDLSCLSLLDLIKSNKNAKNKIKKIKNEKLTNSFSENSEQNIIKKNFIKNNKSLNKNSKNNNSLQYLNSSMNNLSFQSKIVVTINKTPIIKNQLKLNKKNFNNINIAKNKLKKKGIKINNNLKKKINNSKLLNKILNLSFNKKNPNLLNINKSKKLSSDNKILNINNIKKSIINNKNYDGIKIKIFDELNKVETIKKETPERIKSKTYESLKNIYFSKNTFPCLKQKNKSVKNNDNKFKNKNKNINRNRNNQISYNKNTLNLLSINLSSIKKYNLSQYICKVNKDSIVNTEQNISIPNKYKKELINNIPKYKKPKHSYEEKNNKLKNKNIKPNYSSASIINNNKTKFKNSSNKIISNKNNNSLYLLSTSVNWKNNKFKAKNINKIFDKVKTTKSTIDNINNETINNNFNDYNKKNIDKIPINKKNTSRIEKKKNIYDNIEFKMSTLRPPTLYLFTKKIKRTDSYLQNQKCQRKTIKYYSKNNSKEKLSTYEY